ncbi:hypothetical protein LguiB_028132 [Lonicera macranthoides]
MIFTRLWKSISSSSKLQMSPHLRLSLGFDPFYNFCVLAETQFPLLEDEKLVRSRAVDQKLKGVRTTL